MNILAIETSCDDTCISVIKVSGKKRLNFNVLSDIVSSQVKIHRKYGGVYPTLAKREHQKNLVPVLERTLKRAGLLRKSKCQNPNVKSNPKFKNLNSILQREPELFKQISSFFKKYQRPKVDLLAVTIGPGLEPCLWVGVNFAKALSYFWQSPIVAVNHIEAHVLANFIGENQKSKIKNQNGKSKFKKNLPAICLIVSGGHTQLILMRDFGKYKILGETRDDAAGECLDKVAKILGLEYPGGPIIEKLAKTVGGIGGRTMGTVEGRTFHKLPRPMINTKNYDLSFSGLKTAVLYHHKKQSPKTRKSKKYIREMSKEIQQAVIDVLIKKALKAARNYKAKTIILGGGVSANNELRKQLRSRVYSLGFKVNFLVPPKNLCTDNAVMTAVAGYFRWLKNKKGERWRDIEADANLRLK